MTAPENKIEVLYEDKNLLVLNKPAGLIVHSDGRTKEKTLADWLIERYPEIKNIGEPWQKETVAIPRPGIVHRLDRETSGAIVIAKNQETYLFLKKQFQERKVVKKYRAFVYDKLKEKEEVIERPIGKSTKDFRLWSAQRGARGEMREAITSYKVIASNENFSLVEATPKTGRTHQIRVHFKAINHPVVCDRLYAPRQECALGFERLALHSFQIKFVAENGDTIEVEAPYPADFKKALENFAAAY